MHSIFHSTPVASIDSPQPRYCSTFLILRRRSRRCGGCWLLTVWSHSANSTGAPLLWSARIANSVEDSPDWHVMSCATALSFESFLGVYAMSDLTAFG